MMNARSLYAAFFKKFVITLSPMCPWQDMGLECNPKIKYYGTKRKVNS
jgi:hypothetical protein